MARKAILVGDIAVGKTAIFHRLERKEFQTEYKSTVSGALVKLTIPLSDGSTEQINLWDTAGEERYRNLVLLYFHDVSIVIIVFSLTSRRSFENATVWYNLARKQASPSVRYYLVGNKSDKMADRAVTFDEGQAKSVSLEAESYIETSAVTGVGCEELLTIFALYFEKGYNVSPGLGEVAEVVIDPSGSRDNHGRGNKDCC
jgi:small GTP-binding protein